VALVLLLVLLPACAVCAAEGQEAVRTASAGAADSTAKSVAEGAAEAVSEAAAAQDGGIEQVPRVPGIGLPARSANAGLTLAAVHDAVSGWYTVATPAVGFTFSPHFSADLSLSAYLRRSVESFDQSASPGQPPTVQSSAKNDLGDLLAAVHGGWTHGPWSTQATASLTAPTGSRADGLSTGKCTFDFSDRGERAFGPAGIVVDVGLGNSAGLFNSLVTRQYNSLGPLSHYQAGLVFRLPQSIQVQATAWEQLPFGRQTVYFPQPPTGSTQTNAAATFSADDQGFTLVAGAPVQAHILLSGYLNHSLREGLNTASIGLTFVLRPVQRKKRLSLIDRALLEAETGGR
jgi:hypothetical protein